jgi:hypothetical protein
MAAAITKAELCETGVLEHMLYTEPLDGFPDPFERTAHVASTVSTVIFKEQVGFGKTLNADVPLAPDLVGDIWLVMELPPLPADSWWTMSVGYALVESVQLLAGGVVMQSSNGLAMEVDGYLSTPAEKLSGLNEMVGRYDSPRFLPAAASQPKKVRVKLPFFFCRSRVWSALPVFLLDRQRISVRVKIAKFAKAVLFDTTDPPAEVPLTDAYLLVENHFVSNAFKAHVRSRPYVRYVEQVQTHVSQSVQANDPIVRIDLDLMNCVKQLVWVVRETASEDNNDWFNFALRTADASGTELMTTASLLFNGSERVPAMDEGFFRLNATQRHRTVCGDRNIYVVSFAEWPESAKNTGAVNMTKIENPVLVVTLARNNPACSVHVFATSLNVFTIENGVGRFRFLAGG